MFVGFLKLFLSGRTYTMWVYVRSHNISDHPIIDEPSKSSVSLTGDK